MRSFTSVPSWVVTATIVVVAGLLAVTRLLAQGQRPPKPDYDIAVPGTTSVVVALTDSLPSKDFDILIKRRATEKPHDVILVRPGALRAELLAKAVETLQGARRSFGRTPTGDVSFKVPPAGTKSPPRLAEAEGWVKSLKAAKPMDLPGVGVVPLIMLHLFDRELATSASNP
jgi:hypothetical protein